MTPGSLSLNVRGQNFAAGSAGFTTAPTLAFEYGEFRGVDFALDTSAVSGFAYSSISGSFDAGGSNIITAVQAGTGQQFFAAAQKKQTMVSLNFTDTYSVESYNLTVKVTLADGTVKEEVVFIPANTSGVDIRNLVWSILDDMPGIKADKTDGNRLTVKGTDKLLKSIEFSAPKDTDGSDPGIVKLKYVPLATSDIDPKVLVNGKEAAKK